MEAEEGFGMQNGMDEEYNVVQDPLSDADAGSPPWDSDLFGPDSPTPSVKPLDTQRTLVSSSQTSSSKPIPRMAAKRRRRKVKSQNTDDNNSRASSTLPLSAEHTPGSSGPIMTESASQGRRETSSINDVVNLPSSSSPQAINIRQDRLKRSSIQTSAEGTESPDSSSADEWDSELELPNGPVISEDDTTFDEGEVEDELQIVENLSTMSHASNLQHNVAVENTTSRKRKAHDLSDDDEQIDQALPRRVSLPPWNPSQMEQSLALSEFGTPAVMSQRRPFASTPRASRPSGQGRTPSVLSLDEYPLHGTKAREIKEVVKDSEYVPPPRTKAEMLYRRSKEFQTSAKMVS